MDGSISSRQAAAAVGGEKGDATLFRLLPTIARFFFAPVKCHCCASDPYAMRVAAPPLVSARTAVFIDNRMIENPIVAGPRGARSRMSHSAGGETRGTRVFERRTQVALPSVPQRSLLTNHFCAKLRGRLSVSRSRCALCLSHVTVRHKAPAFLSGERRFDSIRLLRSPFLQLASRGTRNRRSGQMTKSRNVSPFPV